MPGAVNSTVQKKKKHGEVMKLAFSWLASLLAVSLPATIVHLLLKLK